MSLTDAERRQLYTDFERALGRDSADLMMQKILPPIDWTDLARQDRVDARFGMIDTRFEMVDARFAMVDAQFVAVRGEIAELRAEVRGQARSVAAINAISVVAASFSTAGLVLAAARLA